VTQEQFAVLDVTRCEHERMNAVVEISAYKKHQTPSTKHQRNPKLQ
jgi:hypothetical protein